MIVYPILEGGRRRSRCLFNALW